MEHLKNELIERYREEMEDVKTYTALSELAKEHGHHKLAHFLGIIAEEESTHAEYLKNTLTAVGVRVEKI